MSIYRRFILLGVITLFLLPGAAGGQSRPLTSPGPDRHLQSDKEDVKSPLEDQREPRLKELREQPAQVQKDKAGKPRELTPKELREQPARVQKDKAGRPRGLTPKELRAQPVRDPEDLAGKSLKNKQVIKPKGSVYRLKKASAEKSASGSHQDLSGPKAESYWWPSIPRPVQPSLPLSPSELSPQQYLEKDSMPGKDKADDKGEEIEKLPQALQKSIKEEEIENLPEELQELIKGEEIENLPKALQKSIKSKLGVQDTMLKED